MGRAECLVGQVNLSWMNGIGGGKWSKFSFVGAPIPLATVLGVGTNSRHSQDS